MQTSQKCVWCLITYARGLILSVEVALHVDVTFPTFNTSTLTSVQTINNAAKLSPFSVTSKKKRPASPAQPHNLSLLTYRIHVKNEPELRHFDFSNITYEDNV